MCLKALPKKTSATYSGVDMKTSSFLVDLLQLLPQLSYCECHRIQLGHATIVELQLQKGLTELDPLWIHCLLNTGFQAS